MADPLKTDLFLTRRAFGEESSDRWTADLEALRGDLRLVRGRENLAQAILNRLFTRQGALADLGHPAYGSRLYQLVGEPNNARTRALAEFYVRESLADEPRIQEIVEVAAAPPPPRPERTGVLEIRIVVRTTGEEPPLAITATVRVGG